MLRDPLVHFLVLGAGLFVLFSAVGGSGSEREEVISITPGQVNHLSEIWSKTWQRPPTDAELEGLIEEHIREEVYYREALAMRLDRDDTIVRRRMRQKFEFLMNDLANAVEPTEEELKDYLREHPDQFRTATRVSFSHVYLNRDRRGEAALEDAQDLLKRLEQEGEKADTASLGDPLLLEKHYNLIRTSEIATLFGSDFAERIAELPQDRWAGPVESGYGLHLVYVRAREESQLPDFEDVRETVRREFVFARAKESSESLYQRLRSKYTIVRLEQPSDGKPIVSTAEARP